MSLRHPKPVFQDPQLGFVGFGAASRAAPDAWRNGPHQEDYAAYCLQDDCGPKPQASAPQQQHPAPAAGGLSLGEFLPSAARAGILREVDSFVMSLPLGTSPGDAEIEEAVASRLYRAELGAAEARAKLGEWSKLAMELKEVVEQQQAQLERERQGHSLAAQPGRVTGGAFSAGLAGGGAASAQPHLAQLQRLVQDMRDELRQAPPAGQQPRQPQRYATRWEDGGRSGSEGKDVDGAGAGGSTQPAWQLEEVLQQREQELAAAQAELQSLRVERSALVAARDAAQREGGEAAAAQLQLEQARREAESAKAERERLRRALIDAEIELQRKSNDAAALQAQLAAASKEKEAAVAAAAGELAAVQADAAVLRQQLAAARAAAEAAGAEREQQLRSAQQTAEQLHSAAAAAKSTAALHRQQKEAADALVTQLQSQVVSLQAAAASSSSAAVAEVALLREQLATAQQGEATARAEARAAAEQLDAVKRAHGEALNAARSSAAQLAVVQEELAASRAALEQAQQRGAGAPTAEALAERDNEISALKAVLDRVTAAAQQKDAHIAAAQREVAAAVAERDAAMADKAAMVSLAAGWRDAAAGSEAKEAALVAAREQAGAAEARLMQLQLSAAADAQRWEERLLALQAQLQEQQRGGAGAAAQQALLQAEAAELRQLLSAKDQQIGALSSGSGQVGRPGSAGTAAVLEQDRLQVQALEVQQAAQLAELQARSWGAAAAAAGSGSRDSTPSPIQRRFQQRLRQLQEQHDEELLLLQQHHEEQLAAERRRAADAAQVALHAHRQQLEALEAEHERQLSEERRRHEAATDSAELQHLMELEAAVEGSFSLDGLSGDSLAERLRGLEARRVQQEGELEVLRATLAAQREAHEQQVAAMEAKQAALVAEGEQQAQQLQQLAALAARPQEPSPRQQARQPQQQSAPQQQAQQAEERHAADVARVPTRAIFSSVLAQQQAGAAAAAAPGAAAAQARSPGPDLALLPGNLRVQDLTSSSGHASLTSSVRRQAARLSTCRITAAAHASGAGGSGAGSPPSAPRSARRQLLLPEGEPAGQHSPRLSRMSTLRSDLSQAAEAALAAGLVGGAAAAAGAVGAGAVGSGRGSFDGVHGAAAAEANRLAGELEEALAECERRGEALHECQGMVEELQAFAEAQKRDLAAVRSELEDSQRSGREGQHRLRGLEEQLLAAQDACGKANSQVTKFERKCAAYREELRSLQAMHDALQSEHTAVCGQLTAAQQQHGAALDRLQRLAERLALTQQEKAQAEGQLAALQQRMQRLRNEHSVEAEQLLHELLLQRLRASSAGDSNSGGRAPPVGDSGTGRPGTADSGAGVQSGSAEEATLAHMQRAQQRQSGGDGSGAAGLPSGTDQQLQQQRQGGLPRSATAPPLALLAPEQQQAVPPQLLAGPSRLPAIATRLPPHLRREACASVSAGGSADQTPMSEQSASSAWSDSVADLGATAQKKKRGALHKLGKMLRGGGKSSRQSSAGAEAAAAAVAAGGGLPPRPRPNPGALTAPLGHSMREQEAAALQGRLLRERREQEEAAVLQRLDSAASAGPSRRPSGLRPAMQERKEQRDGQPAAQAEQQDAVPGRQQLFSAAEDAAEGGRWSDYTAAWVQQQAQQAQEEQQQQAQHAVHREESAAAGACWAPAQRQRPGSGLSDVPLDGASYAAAGPVGYALDSPRRQRRPSSGGSEAPAEGGAYQYPDAAAAGYAAGLAAVEAEGLGPGQGPAHPPPEALHTPLASPVRWHRGIGAAAEGLGRSPSPSPSWQQRDLHVVLNELYDGGEGGARRRR
ncbi:hypothetical protein ABPG75_003648 [Micractinium tetrahymenae]